jgi:deoxyribose-phosphate aldolase
MTLKPLLEDLPALLDHTLLRPEATKAEVLQLCEEAMRYGMTVIFVPPCYVEDAVQAVAGTGIAVGIPIGFPHGNQTTAGKVAEAVEAVARGAKELDMVLNVSRMKSGDTKFVLRDMTEVVRATPDVGHKVILETCFLSREEKVLACRLALDAGMEYVKTSTGFGPAGAVVEDIRLMKGTVAGRAKVKASGGIRDLKTVLMMLDAGADRIGTSAAVKILDEWREQSRCAI